MLWGNCYFCDQFRVSNKITIDIVMKMMMMITILIIRMVIIMVMIVLMIKCYQLSFLCLCSGGPRDLSRESPFHDQQG